MRSSVSLGLLLALVLLAVTDAKRFGGGGGGKRRPSGSSYRPKPAPAPAPKPRPAEQHDFLNAERGHSVGHANQNPSAPQQHNPPGNRPIGFEQFGAGNTHGSPQIGFDKVNTQVQNRPGGSYTPNAPPYPGVGSGSPVGPPPAYHPQGQGQGQAPHYGGVEHPPAYPGRPQNAPPAYTPNQANPHGQTFGNPPPQQGQFGYPVQGQGYHGQQNYGNNYGSSYPQQPSGNYGQGYHPSYPGYGGGGAPSYGGSPFGNSGYNGYNPNSYNPNNFGYSSNPGYYGQGYQGQQKKSWFSGLPIPIPIPIPIGGGFGGGFGGGHGGGYGSGYGSGFGGGSGGSSYNHRLLDTFIKDKEDNSNTGNSTSVFLLNNSTIAPCTTDHFPYGKLNITVVSCTAEFCTGVKVTTVTKVKDVESRHSAWLTMCLEQNETWTAAGDKVQPTVSELQRETINVCRNLTVNLTQANSTAATPTAAPDTATEAPATTTAAPAPATTSTTVCEDVRCSWVNMCMTAIEVVDDCSGARCPFRRSGYMPCVTIKMCRAPNTPLSTFATLNTTVYSVDEFDHRQSQYHATNLTLISYHPPIVFFNPNCSQNSSTSTSGCPPPTSTVTSTSPPSQTQCPAGTTPVLDSAGGTSTTCSPITSTAPTSAVTDVSGGVPAPAVTPANDTSTPAPSPSP